MKTGLLFLFLNFTFLAYSQQQEVFPSSIEKGTLVLINDEIINFENLYPQGDQIYYTNTESGEKEHLFLPSIKSITNSKSKKTYDIGTISNEIIQQHSKTVVDNSVNTPSLKDGMYETFDDLKNNTPTSTTFNLEIPNKKRENYIYVSDQSGKRNKTAFAVVENGILYVRGASLKPYISNKNGFIFAGNRKYFLKMENENNKYVTVAHFSNNTLALIGAVLSGLAGGIFAPGLGSAIAVGLAGSLVFSLISLNKKEAILNIENEDVRLEKVKY